MCLHAKCLVKFSLCRSSATARSEEVVTIMRGYFWKFNTGVELSSESLGKLANWRRRQVDWAWACRQPCVFRRIFCLQRKSARTASGSVSPRVSDHKVLRNLSASEVITYLSEHLGRFSFQKDPLDSAGVSSKEREWRPAAGVRSPGCAFSHLSMAARMENYVSGSSLRCVNWCNALPACEAKAANLQSVEAARSGAGSAGVEQRSSPELYDSMRQYDVAFAGKPMSSSYASLIPERLQVLCFRRLQDAMEPSLILGARPELMRVWEGVLQEAVPSLCIDLDMAGGLKASAREA
ncbi:unnamed protein product [Symbiodinium sp. CCMP2456]|nr:unnamed protein product [Symbiodinium sp. CCMP2456]